MNLLTCIQSVSIDTKGKLKIDLINVNPPYGSRQESFQRRKLSNLCMFAHKKGFTPRILGPVNRDLYTFTPKVGNLSHSRNNWQPVFHWLSVIYRSPRVWWIDDRLLCIVEADWKSIKWLLKNFLDEEYWRLMSKSSFPGSCDHNTIFFFFKSFYILCVSDFSSVSQINLCNRYLS